MSRSVGRTTLGTSFSKTYASYLPLAKALPEEPLLAYKFFRRAMVRLPNNLKLADLPAILPEVFVLGALLAEPGQVPSTLQRLQNVFSSYEIRHSRNRQYTIRDALAAILISQSEQNIKAARDLLLLTDTDFSKPQQQAFVDGLRHIQTLTTFGDLVITVEKLIGNHKKGEESHA